MSADNGDNITLVCVGEEPLTWYYGDSIVMEDGHHRIPQTGLLVVNRVTIEDAGVYTCTDKTGSQSISLLIRDNDDGELENKELFSIIL